MKPSEGVAVSGLDTTSLRRLWLVTRLTMRSHGVTVDIGAVASDRLMEAVAPLELPIFIVTAHNPDGELLSSSDNRARNRRLRANLDARELTWRVAFGRALDGSWAEAGFAISGLSLAMAMSIGGEMGQLAIFKITDEAVVVIATDGSFRDRRVRRIPAPRSLPRSPR